MRHFPGIISCLTRIRGIFLIVRCVGFQGHKQTTHLHLPLKLGLFFLHTPLASLCPPDNFLATSRLCYLVLLPFGTSLSQSFFPNHHLQVKPSGGAGLITTSCLTLVTPWTVSHHDPLSTGFPRQEYWSGLPFPFLGSLPDPGIKPTSPVSPPWQEDSLPLSHLGSPIPGYYWSTKLKYSRMNEKF